MNETSRVLALTTLLVLLPLGGCSWLVGEDGLIEDRKDAYRDARVAEPPQIPEGLEGGHVRDAMVVPNVIGMEEYAELDSFELPRPSSLFSREEDRGVRIQRLGDERWVVAPYPPALVWPRVEQFLLDNGVGVVAEAPAEGIMETEWFEVGPQGYRDVVRAIIAERSPPMNARPWHRMRLRTEQAVRRGSTEIHLLHADSATGSQMAWPEASSNPDIEAEMLNELAAYIASGVGTTGISRVAQDIASQPKAEVLRDAADEPALRLRLGRARAWATVASALENAQIASSGNDDEALTYDIDFDPEDFEEEGGWLSDLFSFGSDGERSYRLTLEPVSDGFDLRVRDPETGELVDADSAEVVLSVIREYAS